MPEAISAYITPCARRLLANRPVDVRLATYMHVLQTLKYQIMRVGLVIASI